MFLHTVYWENNPVDKGLKLSNWILTDPEIIGQVLCFVGPVSPQQLGEGP